MCNLSKLIGNLSTFVVNKTFFKIAMISNSFYFIYRAGKAVGGFYHYVIQ